MTNRFFLSSVKIGKQPFRVYAQYESNHPLLVHQSLIKRIENSALFIADVKSVDQVRRGKA